MNQYDFYKTSSAPSTQEVYDFLLEIKGVTKTASKAKQSAEIRDRLIGLAAGAGGIGMGITQYNMSKKNEKGYTSRDIARERKKAGQMRAEEMGGGKQSTLSKKIESLENARDRFYDESPARAGLIGAGVGAVAGGLGMAHLLKKIKKGVPKV